MKRIGVIVLNFFSAKESINLVSRIDFFGEDGLRILVVDNSCDHEERRQLKEVLPNERLLFAPRNLGYAGGNNLGIRHLWEEPLEFFAIMNPDVELPVNPFPYLLEHFEKDSKLAATGPRICFATNKSLIYSDGGFLSLAKGYVSPTHSNHGLAIEEVNDKAPREVDYLNGSFLVIARTALGEIGLIPEFYFLYFEETHWATLARKRGWKLIVDRNVVCYQSISSKGSLYQYQMTRNHILFNRLLFPGFSKIRLTGYLFWRFLAMIYHLNLKNALAIARGLIKGYLMSKPR